MAKAKQPTGKREITIDFGQVSEKQQQFLDSKTFFTCYGGARGGGKTHVLRLKAVGLALSYPGIKILIMRATYKQLEENHIVPILQWVPNELMSYNGSSHVMTFTNGSRINFGHWSGDMSESEYRGQEYDVMFIDEATDISERSFNFLCSCIRGANNFPKRCYLTCNPGGVGHRRDKRLFIDRAYKTNCDDPEENENPDDYTFIFVRVDDNKFLLESSPQYLRQLASMPEDLKMAHRYGDWDAIGGNYFKEFSLATHSMKPFKVPGHWTRYRSFDYGLDMFACFWWAVDEDGRAWCIREYERKGLIVQDAAKEILDHTLPGEKIEVTYAPPDMWNRQKDTGRTMAELFMVNGVGIVRSDNNRVQGHMMMKEMLAPLPLKDRFVRSQFPDGKAPATLPGLMFFDNCKEVMSDIRDIQADETNSHDCAKQPHDVTHSIDGCRYFCVSRTLKAILPEAPKIIDDMDETATDYQSYMTGGECSEAYLQY